MYGNNNLDVFFRAINMAIERNYIFIGMKEAKR